MSSSSTGVGISVESREALDKLLFPHGIYMHLCPNCGGAIEDNRLLFRNACSKCMASERVVEVKDIEEVVKYVRELKPDGVLKRVIDVRSFVKEFRYFFAKCVGSTPWNLQESWAIRLARNQSFALIAPTGVGKTTFGLVMALYLSYRYGKKTYVLVPTSVLVRLYEDKVREYMDKAGIVVQVVAIHSKVSAKRRAELENIIREGSFDILITTSRYLQRNFDDVFSEFLSRGNRIDFLFVDDVDAIMKGSKAIDMALKLIGFTDKDIEDGYKLVSLRMRLARCEGSEDKEKSFCYENGKHVREVFEEIQQRVLSKRQQLGSLVISSATGRARGKRVKLFRELLGFSIGSAVEIYRNVVDTYIQMPEEHKVPNLVADLIERLGDGCLIYVPIDRGLEYAEKLRNDLKARGLDVEVLSSKKTDVLEKFIAGEYRALIGVATYYGLLVRGIDIPEKIRYAIFVGVPRHKISLSQVGYNPQNLLRLLTVLSEVVHDAQQKDVLIKYIARLRRVIRQTSVDRLRIVVEKLSAGEAVEDPIASVLRDARNIVTNLLSKRDVVDSLKNYSKAAIVEEDGALYILIPDAPTYIQASGRTSRLFVGGVTTGLSILLVDDQRLVNGLVDRVRFWIEDFELKPLESIDLDQVLRRIDEDRELVRLVRAGKVVSEDISRRLHVKTVLFIVESPNKARTIASFFGRPTYREFNGLRVYETNVGEMHLIIASSGGHIYELVEEDIEGNSVYGIVVTKSDGRTLFLPKYDFIKKCLSCGTQFVKGDKCPVCGSTRYRSSRGVVETMQSIALEVDEIVIATDPDAEGEKIGYDIAVSLAPFAKSIVRAEFHEVTRKAVLNALRNPRDLDLSLIEAQITRRIEDRLLGFALSEYVTSKLKSLNLVTPSREGRLSAGRVQTPVLGRILELYINRVRTLRKSKVLYLDGLTIEVPQEVLERILGEEVKKLSPSRVRVVLTPLAKKVETVYPPPPFTTDEMIAEAHRVLKLDAVETMRIAQDIFEMGFITYHRTDSTRISSTGISVAKEYLISVYGDRYAELFEPRTWGTGGAHEGIRPTRPIDVSKLRELIAEGVIELPTRMSVNHYKLYDLIFRRFIASQMKPCIAERTVYLATIKVDDKEVIKQTIEVYTNILEPGFTLVYNTIRVIPLPYQEVVLTPSRVITMFLSEHPIPSQGDIIRWMKETGIGRPSTYAKIVDIIIKRGYVISGRGGVLIPGVEGLYVYILLAGTTFAESELGHEELVSVLRSIYRRKQHVVDSVIGLFRYVRDDIKRMITVRRTKELYEKIQAIEENKISYIDVVSELFREVCTHILVELNKGVEICREIVA